MCVLLSQWQTVQRAQELLVVSKLTGAVFVVLTTTTTLKILFPKPKKLFSYLFFFSSKSKNDLGLI